MCKGILLPMSWDYDKLSSTRDGNDCSYQSFLSKASFIVDKLHTVPRMPFLPVFVMAGAENKLTCVAGRAFLGSKPRYPIP